MKRFTYLINNTALMYTVPFEYADDRSLPDSTLQNYACLNTADENHNTRNATKVLPARYLLRGLIRQKTAMMNNSGLGFAEVAGIIISGQSADTLFSAKTMHVSAKSVFEIHSNFASTKTEEWN